MKQRSRLIKAKRDLKKHKVGMTMSGDQSQSNEEEK